MSEPVVHVAHVDMPLLFPEHDGHSFPPEDIRAAVEHNGWVRALDVKHSRLGFGSDPDWTYYGTIDTVRIDGGEVVAGVSLSTEGLCLVKAGFIISACVIRDAIDHETGSRVGMRILGVSLTPEYNAYAAKGDG